MLEVILFVINRITRTARSITVRVTALNHKARNDAMEKQTVIKSLVRELHKVRDSIRSCFEVQINNNFPFVSCYLGKNLSNTRVILVKDFSLSIGTYGKAQERCANNDFFEQNLTSVVISFCRFRLTNKNIVFF